MRKTSKMRKAIKYQVLMLIALLVLVIMLSGILAASGSDSDSSASNVAVQSAPGEAPGLELPAPESSEQQEPATEPEGTETQPEEQATEASVPAEEPAETSPSKTAAGTPGVTLNAEAVQQQPTPLALDGPQIAVVEALIYQDTNGNGVYDEPLVLIDGVTVSLYRLEVDGTTETFISSRVSGPGAYGPFGIYLPPSMGGWSGGWVGWNQLPTTVGDQPYVDYILKLTPPSGYFSTNGTYRKGRVWAQNPEHPFCWWNYYYLEDGAFGLGRKSKITGYKFKDLNENGVKDEGEPGIPGVTILLDGGQQSAVTNGDGFYSFDVSPGTFTVSVDESTAPGYYPTTPTSLDVTVEFGQDKNNINFGNAPYGSISGHKYLDKDKSGDLTAGDLPLKDVTIKLTGTTNGGEPVSLETTTGEDGSYSFTNLKAGNYTITEVVPADMTNTSPISVDRTLAPGENITDVDFFNASTKGKIDGYKFLDLNENGIKDEGEPGMPNVKITLNGDEQTAFTDGVGYFSFVVDPGTYTVAVDESTAPGYYPTTDTSFEVDVPEGGTETVYFGNAPYGSITGHKWEDVNGNQVYDEDDLPVEDVTIKLTGTTNVGNESVNLQTTTDEFGSFSFTNLKAGTYKVTEEVPSDMFAVSPPDGIIDLILAPGQAAKDVDFLNQRREQPSPGSIVGHKYNDKNRNGQKDEGELGIAGVTIKLTGTTVSGSPVNEQTTTGTDGSFSFTSLEPGIYTVSEEVPVGWEATSEESVGVTLTSGQTVTVDFLNAQQGGTPTPTPTPTTPGATLPFTGMNQMPISLSAGLAILLGVSLMVVGILRRRQQLLQLARTGATLPGRVWK